MPLAFVPPIGCLRSNASHASPVTWSTTHTPSSPRVSLPFDMRSPGDANTYFFFFDSLGTKAPAIQAMPWLVTAAAASPIELAFMQPAFPTALDFRVHSTWLHVRNIPYIRGRELYETHFPASRGFYVESAGTKT